MLPGIVPHAGERDPARLADAIRSIFGAKFIDLPEDSAPPNPSGDTARIYAKDDGGTTKLFYRDSAGNETEIGGGGAGTPVGGLIPYGGTTEPPGWLFAYGQNVSRTTYADLFDAYGTTYGAGDGSTTFGLPDLRGRVIAGQDDMGGTSANRLTGLSGGVNGDTLGGTGGAETHTQTIAEMPSHSHVPALRGSSGSSEGFNNTSSAANATNVGNTGGGGAHNNVQPTIILNYIIYAGA